MKNTNYLQFIYKNKVKLIMFSSNTMASILKTKKTLKKYLNFKIHILEKFKISYINSSKISRES